MNRYKLSKAGINANEGIQRFNGKKELYEKLLYEFPEDPHFGSLEEAVKNQNAEDGFQAAHALKSLTGNLSLNQLHEDIVPLVEELRAGRLEKTEELFKPVKADYDLIIEALKETD